MVFYVGDFFGQIVNINIEVILAHIYKYRCGTLRCHSLGRGEEGKVGNKDGITRTYAQHHQRHTQSIGAACTSNAVFHAHIVGQLAFQSGHDIAEDERTRSGNTEQRCINFGLHRLILSM